MLTAGLVGEISDVVGLPSTNLELIDYAQKATIQSAVNTVLAVSIDGQNFEKALMQGMTTAALSTATSYLANQIGQSYFDKQLNWLEHKTLHALLGGLSGGVSSKLFGGSFERGAISGALGAVVAEAVAEMLKPDLTSEMLSSQNKNLSKDEFEKEFMEKAQQSSKWADFVGSVSAFGMGLDTNIAYQTSSNATQNNFLPGILLALTVGSTVYEGYQIHQTYKNEGGEAALKHLGITVVSAAVVGGIATVGFKVGKAVYPTLHEAYKAAVASRPILASALTALESRLGKIEAYVKDQFNYKEFFAAERLRLEGGIKPKTYKGGKYAEAEDALGLKRLSDEQPWVVRSGQEWKTKVFGRGQNTQTEGHAFRSYREAIDAAKREDVEAVFLNRGIRKVTNHPVEKPNTRPDVTIRRTDGKIDQIEVPSKSDKDYLLMERMNATEKRLPEQMQGGVNKIIEIIKVQK